MLSEPVFELPVHFDGRRHASQQERQLRLVAGRSGGIRCHRTWYGTKLIGAEPELLAALAELAGEFKFGRLRPRSAIADSPLRSR